MRETSHSGRTKRGGHRVTPIERLICKAGPSIDVRRRLAFSLAQLEAWSRYRVVRLTQIIKGPLETGRTRRPGISGLTRAIPKQDWKLSLAVLVRKYRLKSPLGLVWQSRSWGSFLTSNAGLKPEN